jgi:hypothetical protein
MLIGLVLRGVAFDFRVKAREGHKATWDRLFFAGSTIASVAQGWMLGRYVSGFGSGWNYPLFAAAIAVALPMAVRADGRVLADHEDRGRAAGAGDRLGEDRLAAGRPRHGADLDGDAVDQRDGAQPLVRAARDHRPQRDPAARRRRACTPSAPSSAGSSCAARSAGCRSRS